MGRSSCRGDAGPWFRPRRRSRSSRSCRPCGSPWHDRADPDVGEIPGLSDPGAIPALHDLGTVPGTPGAGAGSFDPRDLIRNRRRVGRLGCDPWADDESARGHRHPQHPGELPHEVPPCQFTQGTTGEPIGYSEFPVCHHAGMAEQAERATTRFSWPPRPRPNRRSSSVLQIEDPRVQDGALPQRGAYGAVQAVL